MKISNETKIGVLTVISIALLIIGFNILKGNDLFSRTDTIYAVYDNVQGLASSNPVQVNGFTIGHVSSMTIQKNNASKIIVRLIINKGVNIPANSVASIASPDLLSAKVISIQFGDSPEYLKDEDTIATAAAGSLTDKLMNEVKPLSGKVQATLASLDSVLNAVNSIFDVKTTENIKSSIASISATLGNLSATARHTDEIVQNMIAVTGNLKDNNDTINAILSNAKSISDVIAGNLNGTLQDFSHSVSELNTIMDRVNSGEGSLGKLVNDKKLYDNLQASTLNLNRLLEDLRLNPQRYVHFSVFGRKSKTQPLPADTLSQ